MNQLILFILFPLNSDDFRVHRSYLTYFSKLSKYWSEIWQRPLTVYRCSRDWLFWNISQNSLENAYDGILRIQACHHTKNDSVEGVFLWNLRSFPEKQFFSTALGKFLCNIAWSRLGENFSINPFYGFTGFFLYP